MELVDSGIEALGKIKWGSHFCHFYHDHSDLVDTLVPFFRAGLEDQEKCIWITSEPLVANDARTLLKKAVPHLSVLEAKGQIEILDHSAWYSRSGQKDPDAVLNSWVNLQSEALESGWKGLRVTGNSFWLERKDWKAFMEYEKRVNETFAKHRIIGLCSYCLNRTGSSDVFDVVRNHNFALLRQEGEWELLETAQTRKSKDQLVQLNMALKENLIEAKDSAEAANRLKSAFLANMSHEIRTPLGAILGFAELLRETASSNQDRDLYIETIQRNGKALVQLIDDILDVSKVEAGRLNIEHLDFSPKDLVNDVTGTFAAAVQAKNLRFHIEFSNDLPLRMKSDPLRIRQIMLNLIGNAIKFTDQGEVRVNVEKVNLENSKSALQFTVRDTGIGMSEKQKASLFQAFRQGDDSTTRRFGGTGLGLFLSKRLAQILDGDLELRHSAPGVGSTFVATIAMK